MWMALANLPLNEAEVLKRIGDLEARLKMRGDRPEPDIPDLDSIPSPAAIQTARDLARCCDYFICRLSLF
jgi:hypothetical protein